MYHYLNQSGCVNVPGMDDVAEFQEVEKSASAAGFYRGRTGLDVSRNLWYFDRRECYFCTPQRRLKTDERTRRQTCCQLL